MPFTVTSAERNLVNELGGQPAMARLQEIVQAASEADRELMRNGLHLGVVVDEHKLDFTRGDFLVRNVLGADRRNGAIAVGERGRGRARQCSSRCATRRPPTTTSGRCSTECTATPRSCSRATAGARTCSPSRITTRATVEELLGPVPLAGAFCAGEIGPIGGRNFLAQLHGQHRGLRTLTHRGLERWGHRGPNAEVWARRPAWVHLGCDPEHERGRCG